MKAGTPWKAMTIFWTTWSRTRRILFVFKVKNYLHAAASKSKHRWSHKAEGLTGLIQPKPSLTAEERNSTYWGYPSDSILNIATTLPTCLLFTSIVAIFHGANYALHRDQILHQTATVLPNTIYVNAITSASATWDLTLNEELLVLGLPPAFDVLYRTHCWVNCTLHCSPQLKDDEAV